MDRKDHEAFVQELYQHLLRRAPRAEELAECCALLDGEGGARALFLRLVRLPEYRAKQGVPSTFAPGHYHSPVVDPAAVAGYHARSRQLAPGDIAGIEIPAERMREFWTGQLELIRATPFPAEAAPQFRYYAGGGPFPIGDAIVLRAMLAARRPARIVEIGSGFSTACMLDSADELGLAGLKVTCIEPYPQRLKSLLRPADAARVEIVERPVQGIALDVFRALQPRDILFVDSTHVLKTGSDVHYELFDVLPSVAPGVAVHFHDCQYPFEYPAKWVFDLNYSWNEVYAVRAFLMYNERFRIVFWNSFFANAFRKELAQEHPQFLQNPGSSLWLERR